MPGFFFHYRQADDYCVDDAGVEFDTFELAYLDAFETAREMWAELMSRRVDPRSCSFEIADSAGNILAILNFKEVLENCAPLNGRAPTHQIQQTFARAVETAHRARCLASDFNQQLVRARSQLESAKQLVGLLEKMERRP
jgi:hypothetical protein